LRRILCAILILALFSGCGGKSTPNAPTPLRVAAASDLQAAFPILAARFKLDRGCDVEPVFGASGLLAEQIKQGAPFDLFLSANTKYVDDLAAASAIDRDSLRPYATGSLVLAIHEASGVDIHTLDDLKKPEIKKIAIANPDVAPYGAAARQALRKEGLWDALEPKIVRGGTVRQALQYVESGNAEVGLVGRSIADVKGVRSIPIDPKLHDPIVQSMGVVSASSRKADARAFADFLSSPVGRGILADFGLDPPPTGPKTP
jgi:molybdate transport system substrate-binding protein